MRASRLVGPALLALVVTASGLLAAPSGADPGGSHAAPTGGAAVAPASGPTSEPAPAPRGNPPRTRVAVMTQNIFYGGDDYDLATGGFCPVSNGCPKALHRLARIIAVSGADVVGVQEAEENTRRLAHLLGWHASPQAHVISRFPILDPPHSHGLFTYVEPVPGRVIAVANTHLPSTPYGPYQVRQGASKQRVLQLERTLREAALDPVLARLPRLAARGIPVFLTGDFNSPSYLDWTRAVARHRPAVPYAVRWPASLALAKAGFRDSYRDVHPDPVADPGFTWSPGGPETRRHDFPDRIDWVLHAGPSRTLSSLLVGEAGNRQVDLAFPRPYPTDHRGVVSTFSVRPAPAPALVSPHDRRVVVGSRLRVRFHGSGQAHEVVGLLRGDHLGPPARAVGTAGARDGVVSLRTAHLRPGRYRVVLMRSTTMRTEASAPIWVYGPRSHPRLTSDRHTYRVGQPIHVRFTRAPGNNLDWIGLYRCRRHCGGVGSYLMYRYTHTDVEGTVRFSRHDWVGEGSTSWPLPPGQYIARLLLDDGYHAIGRSPRFRVVR